MAWSVGYYLPGKPLGQSTKVLWTLTDFIRKSVLTFSSWPFQSEGNLSTWFQFSWDKNQGKVKDHRQQVRNGQLTGGYVSKKKIGENPTLSL